MEWPKNTDKFSPFIFGGAGGWGSLCCLFGKGRIEGPEHRGCTQWGRKGGCFISSAVSAPTHFPLPGDML